MEQRWCEDCANVEAVSRKSPYPRQWLCTMYPNPHAEHGFVKRTAPVDQPLRRCHDMNPRGDCEEFLSAVPQVRLTPDP
jgi:hypothetical protein